MSIIRTKKDERYFVAANEPFNDDALSWEARGMMGYLLSKPDGWIVRTSDLLRQTDAGKYKTQRIINELKDAGYMRRFRERDDDGRLHWVTEVYERRDLNPDWNERTEGQVFRRSGNSTDEKPDHIVKTDFSNSTTTAADDDTSAHYARVVRVYEDEIGLVSPLIAEQLQHALDVYGADVVVDAIAEAARASVRRWSYADSILRRWQTEGRDAPRKTNGNGNGKQRQSQGNTSARDELLQRVQSYATGRCSWRDCDDETQRVLRAMTAPGGPEDAKRFDLDTLRIRFYQTLKTKTQETRR